MVLFFFAIDARIFRNKLPRCVIVRILKQRFILSDTGLPLRNIESGCASQ